MLGEALNPEEARLTCSPDEIDLVINFFKSSITNGYRLYGPYRRLDSTDVVFDVIGEPPITVDTIDDRIVYKDIFAEAS